MSEFSKGDEIWWIEFHGAPTVHNAWLAASVKHGEVVDNVIWQDGNDGRRYALANVVAVKKPDGHMCSVNTLQEAYHTVDELFAAWKKVVGLSAVMQYIAGLERRIVELESKLGAAKSHKGKDNE